jgi:hypothetical protein
VTWYIYCSVDPEGSVPDNWREIEWRQKFILQYMSAVKQGLTPTAAHLHSQQHQAASNDNHSYNNNTVNTVQATVTLI